MQLQLVNVGTKLLGDYASIATRGLMDQIKELAAPLEGKRVLHLSATAFGGGVAEINYTLVPLMRDAGLDVEWRIIHGQDEFFDVTKTIHNALQGDPVGLSEEQREVFVRYQKLNAEAVEGGSYDFVIVHDPQPVGVIEYAPDLGRHWTWRCHIDLSEPNPSVLDFLLPWIVPPRRGQSSTGASTCPRRRRFPRRGSGRRPSTRSRRRTWRSRRRTRPTSSTSSGST